MKVVEWVPWDPRNRPCESHPSDQQGTRCLVENSSVCEDTYAARGAIYFHFFSQDVHLSI
jgi:hypothetical protein